MLLVQCNVSSALCCRVNSAKRLRHLFEQIDTDNDGKFNATDFRFFLHRSSTRLEKMTQVSCAMPSSLSGLMFHAHVSPWSLYQMLQLVIARQMTYICMCSCQTTEEPLTVSVKKMNTTTNLTGLAVKHSLRVAGHSMDLTYKTELICSMCQLYPKTIYSWYAACMNRTAT